jgi:hypothetical protein
VATGTISTDTTETSSATSSSTTSKTIITDASTSAIVSLDAPALFELHTPSPNVSKNEKVYPYAQIPIGHHDIFASKSLG